MARSSKISKDRLKAKKKKRERIIFNWLIIFACLVLIISLYFWVFKEPLELNIVTKCLKEQDAKFYCSDHLDVCQEQKRVFGYFFKDVNYLNCDYKECAGIDKFPTWVIGDEEFGFLSLKKLEEICS